MIWMWENGVKQRKKISLTHMDTKYFGSRFFEYVCRDIKLLEYGAYKQRVEVTQSVAWVTVPKFNLLLTRDRVRRVLRVSVPLFVHT